MNFTRTLWQPITTDTGQTAETCFMVLGNLATQAYVPFMASEKIKNRELLRCKRHLWWLSTGELIAR